LDALYTFLRFFLSTAVVLGVLIFIHELGHFVLAKRMGVTVLRFSLGFGRRIAGFTRGDTEYRLSIIPLGGYVKMLGEDSEEELTEEQKSGSFSHQPVRKRFAIVLAGPVCNFLLAIVLLTGIYTFAGVQEHMPVFGSVLAGSPAEQAGLKAGDKVLSIDGAAISTWEDLTDKIESSKEKPLSFQIARDEEVLTITVTPNVVEDKNLFGEPVKKMRIGVGISEKSTYRKINPLYAGYYAVERTWEWSILFLTTIVKLIQAVVPLKALGGPIFIAQMAGQVSREGVVAFIGFMAFISVNLGVLNLLPIPILDGGHLFFFIIEAILGRPISPKKIEFALKVGLAALILLMVVVIYNDINRLDLHWIWDWIHRIRQLISST
jgi:regulator of sigma E protease